MITTENPATNHYFLEPLDVLFFRGNRLFGDAGSFGESQIPPWPSVAAGALRSHMLATDGTDLKQFARGEVVHPVLGTPQVPGSFELSGFHLARKLADGRAEPLYAAPFDMAITQDESGRLNVGRLGPVKPVSGIQSSCIHPYVAVLPERRRNKPLSGFWLTSDGWQRWLNGLSIAPESSLISSSDLWGLDNRVGIGLNEKTRSVEDGKLFTAQAAVFRPDIGFVAALTGAELPVEGTLRLGGDGRGAAAIQTEVLPIHVDYGRIVSEGRCRLILTTPGLFKGGWVPDCFVQSGEVIQFKAEGVSGQLVCAAIGRPETVSGWDLARWKPKTARRAVPNGSVYWVDNLKADEGSLRRLAQSGLWQPDSHDVQRRAEGFNRFSFAVY